MASETKAVEIGFFGGAMSCRLSDEELVKLRDAVRKGEWAEVQTSDGLLSINGANVIFMRVDAHPSQIGFQTG